MGLLDGKVGLVTGAASGIGRATAIMFSREGAQVAVADIDVQGGMETVMMIRERGGEAIFIETDVSKAEQVENMVVETVETFGSLDCVSNNAATGVGLNSMTSISQREWNHIIAVCLTGVWQCMKYEILAMLQGGGGSIVNIGSIAGIKGEPFLAAYSAAKGGIIALTKTAAAEYAQQDIRVNAVCPGGVRTPALEKYLNLSPSIAKRIITRHAQNRIGEPEEVANAVAWLCSNRSSFVTGHIMVVDGGSLVKSEPILPGVKYIDEPNSK